MTSEQQSELETLLKRFKTAEEYEQKQYMNDIPEGKEWAEKALLQIVRRLGELWDVLTPEEQQFYFNKYF